MTLNSMAARMSGSEVYRIEGQCVGSKEARLSMLFELDDQSPGWRHAHAAAATDISRFS